MTTSEASSIPPSQPGTAPTTATSDPPAPRPVAAVLEDVALLADDSAVEPVQAEIRALRTLLQGARNRVAVVGSFNVGKSTLVNHLLGDEIVPTSSLPNTSQAVRVIAGDRPEIRVTWPDGRDEVRDIAAANWARLQPSDDAVAPASIVVTLDQEWLRACRLELVDTPGINEDIGRFAIARDIAMHSDVVMLVVSADAPFSMTERAFLEEEVLARHVPAVNLVVTRLDHAEGQEREVLRAIESRARAVVPQVPVFPGPRPGNTGTAEIAHIRSALTAHVTGAEGRHDREHQVAARLVDLVNSLVDLASSGVQAENMRAEERRARAEQAMSQIADQMRNWDDVRQAMQRRQRALMRVMRRRVEDERTSVLNALRLDFSHADDLQEWWTRELPLRLRRELLLLGRALEQQLIDTFTADLGWLESQLRRQFAVAGARVPPEAEPVEPGPIEEVVSGIPSDRRRQLLSTLWNALVSALEDIKWTKPEYRMVYKAVAQPAAGAVEGFITDQVTAEHRRAAEPRLAAYLDRNLDIYLNAVTARLEGLYAAEIDNLEKMAEAWRLAHLDAARKPPDAGSDWKAVMQRARQLLDEVTAIGSLGLSPPGSTGGGAVGHWPPSSGKGPGQRRAAAAAGKLANRAPGDP
jgi:small GTP-binding protein